MASEKSTEENAVQIVILLNILGDNEIDFDKGRTSIFSPITIFNNINQQEEQNIDNFK